MVKNWKKVHFLKLILGSKNIGQDPKPYLDRFCPRIPKLVLKIVLHKQMTEQLSFEVDVRNGKKSEKVNLLKCIFELQKYFGPPTF